MARSNIALALAFGAMVLSPTSALAQAKKPPVTPPNKADVDRAVQNLRIFLSALQSDKIPAAVKSVLFECIYNNPFSQISSGTDKALDSKKMDKSNANNVVSAMAAVCGYRPGQVPPAK